MATIQTFLISSTYSQLTELQLHQEAFHFENPSLKSRMVYAGSVFFLLSSWYILISEKGAGRSNDDNTLTRCGLVMRQ